MVIRVWAVSEMRREKCASVSSFNKYNKKLKLFKNVGINTWDWSNQDLIRVRKFQRLKNFALIWVDGLCLSNISFGKLLNIFLSWIVTLRSQGPRIPLKTYKPLHLLYNITTNRRGSSVKQLAGI